MSCDKLSSSFAEDYAHLAAGKPVTTTSRLITLAPEYDQATRLIRVGGRLRCSEHMEAESIHPVVLDPAHKVTKLLIHDVDKDLRHPGSERLFAEIQRRFWILHGREASTLNGINTPARTASGGEPSHWCPKWQTFPKRGSACSSPPSSPQEWTVLGCSQSRLDIAMKKDGGYCSSV